MRVLRYIRPVDFEATQRAKFYQLQQKDQQDIHASILELQTTAPTSTAGAKTPPKQSSTDSS